MLFGFGETVRGTKTIPVKLDETVSFAAGDSAGLSSVIDREGNLYYLYDKLVTYNNTDVPVAAENVKAASDNFFLTSDGNLYEKPTDYNWTWYDQPKLIDSGVSSFSARGQMVLYLKDNSVYYGRVERPGVSWNDGLTIPTPVKVFENAKSASLGSRFLVVDETTRFGAGLHSFTERLTKGKTMTFSPHSRQFKLQMTWRLPTAARAFWPM